MNEYMAEELESQPRLWARAAELGAASRILPEAGQRVAVVGCGTSWFMAQAYAALREDAGHGVTDAFTASEARLERGYDVVVAITRSGTTSEVLDLLRDVPGSPRVIGIVGSEDSPLTPLTDDRIALPFADERSVVQTRFATSALALLRASLGEDLGTVVADGERALSLPLMAGAIHADQITFLGTGWTIGLAHEAALKMREASQSWTESYTAMEYRHGPISIAAPGRATWVFGPTPVGLAETVESTGALLIESDLDPMAGLLLAQRVALERARRRGLNADLPRNLTRSVILEPAVGL